MSQFHHCPKSSVLRPTAATPRPLLGSIETEIGSCDSWRSYRRRKIRCVHYSPHDFYGQIEVASPRDASLQSLHRVPISPRSSKWPGPPLHSVPALAPLDRCRFSDSDDTNNDQPPIPERHATMDTKTERRMSVECEWIVRKSRAKGAIGTTSSTSCLCSLFMKNNITFHYLSSSI